MRKILFFLIFISFLVSCSSNLIYETFKRVDVDSWSANNPVVFKVTIKEEQTGDIFISLRNTYEYEKSNLWLFVEHKTPAGVSSIDTLNCPLADDYGNWLGNGFSDIYLTKHLLKKQYPLKEKGEWTFSVTQAMRSEKIKGISEVGLIISNEK